jgi:hypothetical protein
VFKHQLQHVILEIGRRFDVREFYVVGSAAILATLPDPPVGALTATRDVDVIPPDGDERLADQISFVIGEASEFDAEYGYYAQGVSSDTPRFAPADWKTRAIPIRVAEFTAWCMEPGDLVLSKLGVGREKDLDFAQSAADLNLVSLDDLLHRLPMVDCSEPLKMLLRERIQALFSDVDGRFVRG